MGKEERLYPAQAGVIMKFAAKEGKRDELLKALSDLNKKNSDAADWVLCPTEEDENLTYAFKFFDDEKARENYLSKTAGEEDAAISALVSQAAERHCVHIIYSGTEAHPDALIEPHQSGNVLIFPAKHGMSDDLFELTNKLHFNGDPDGPTDWILCRADDDYDQQMAFEFYRDDASFERHISNPALDGGHNKVIDMVDMTRDMAKYKIYARYSN